MTRTAEPMSPMNNHPQPLKPSMACARLAFSILLPAVLLALAPGCSRKINSDVMVLARVGAREITAQDFEQEVQWYLTNHRPLPERQVLLDQMISHEVRLQKAKALGLENDPDVRHRYEMILTGKLEERELQPRLQDVKVSVEEVKAAYDKDLARYTRPAKVRLAIVFIKRDRKTSTEKLAEIEARIGEARRLALALPLGTKGFGSVAADYSEDQASRYRGGDAGWFDQGLTEYRLPAEVVTAGLALEKQGDISEVVKAENGFYLVTKLDSREAVATPLSQVENPIQRRIADEKRKQTLTAFDQQLRTFVPVQTYPQALARIQYPAASVAKADETQPPVLQGASLSSDAKTPVN